MDVIPLKKEIFEKAKALGIVEIQLTFRGGSDEGYLYIDCRNKDDELDSSLESMIDTWVWEVYEYSGAGDGSGDYGDDIVYNLETMEATTQYWQHEQVYQDEKKDKFELANADD